MLQRNLGHCLTTELKELIGKIQPSLSNKTVSVATVSSGLEQMYSLQRDVSTMHMIKKLLIDEKKQSFKKFPPTIIKAEQNENVKALMKYHNML